MDIICVGACWPDKSALVLFGTFVQDRTPSKIQDDSGRKNVNSERKTENHKDPQVLDLGKRRRVSYKQKWKKPGQRVVGRQTTFSKKRIEVLSNKDNSIRYTPSLLFVESDCDQI